MVHNGRFPEKRKCVYRCASTWLCCHPHSKFCFTCSCKNCLLVLIFPAVDMRLFFLCRVYDCPWCGRHVVLCFLFIFLIYRYLFCVFLWVHCALAFSWGFCIAEISCIIIIIMLSCLWQMVAVFGCCSLRCTQHICLHSIAKVTLFFLKSRLHVRLETYFATSECSCILARILSCCLQQWNNEYHCLQLMSDTHYCTQHRHCLHSIDKTGFF